MGLCYKHRKWTGEDLEKVKELYLKKVPSNSRYYQKKIERNGGFEIGGI